MCAAIGARRHASAVCPRARAPGRATRPRALPLYAEAIALLLAALSVVAPPVGLIGLAAPALAAASPVAAARARSTPACGSSGRSADALTRWPRQEARPRRHRRAQARDARARDRHRPRPGAGAALAQEGVYVDDCVAAFPSVTPVCAATITTGRRTRPPPHPEHELVPPRGGTLRRVRLELLGQPPVRRAALAHRHGLQDERRAPLPRRADGVRDPRRRRCAHRRNDLPDLPRPPSPRGRQRDRAGSDRHLDAVPAHHRRPARALLRRPLRQHARPAAAASSGCRAFATSTRAASAPTWSRTTCSISCSSRCPTTTRTRTRTVPTRRSPRSPPPTGSSSDSCTPPEARRRSSRNTQ